MNLSEKIKNIAIICLAGVFLFGLFAWSLLKPDDEASISERRPLAKFPEMSFDSVMSGEFMTSFEKYTLDQFPMRDTFRTAKSITAFYILRQKDNNDIYIKDGYAAKLEYPMDESSIEYAAQRFRFVYDEYLKESGSKVYLSVIPDKNYFSARTGGYLSIDYDAFIEKLRSNVEYAEYIDITGLLELDDYYRTDTHWRQEKIPDVAQYLAGQMGTELSEEYTKEHAEAPFYGVYYGQSALPLPADELYYLDNSMLENCKVYDYETSSFIPVYDLEKTLGNDPYEMFLSGPKSLITIENPDAVTDKELIVFRDSFGSSIAPLLAEGYAKITLVDIRYMSPSMLGNFIRFDGQDVLILYSTSVLNNSVTIK